MIENTDTTETVFTIMSGKYRKNKVWMILTSEGEMLYEDAAARLGVSSAGLDSRLFVCEGDYRDPRVSKVRVRKPSVVKEITKEEPFTIQVTDEVNCNILDLFAIAACRSIIHKIALTDLETHAPTISAASYQIAQEMLEEKKRISGVVQ